jgi:arylsulfatase A-like enzyme
MAGNKQKNIVLIMTDQQRWDTLGCYGAPICRTPNIDKLATRGIRFSTVFTPTSPCSPARAALFTGLYPHKNHVLRNGGILNPEVPNLADALSKSNYNLGYAGKWHVDRAKVPSEYGFEGKDFPNYGYPPTNGYIEGLRYMQRIPIPPHYNKYIEEKGLEPPKVLKAMYGDNPGKQNQEMYALQSGDIESSFEKMVGDFTVDLIRQFSIANENEGKPFLIWANFWGPHTPCLVPEPYYSMYNPEDIPEEPNFKETWERKPDVHRLYARLWGLEEKDWGEWREIVARYWGYVTMIDDLVGQIVGELEAQGLIDNTLVIFTTDHGDQMGSHKMIEKGCFAYEESWRLPLVAAHPECEAPGSVCDELVYLHDLFPTFLECAGVSLPDVPDSQSILSNILGRDAPKERDSFYGIFTGHLFPAPLRFVRTRTHKFVYNMVGKGELYDLVNDPGELNNLFGQPEVKDIQEDLMTRMREHMVRLEDPLLRQFDVMRHVY